MAYVRETELVPAGVRGRAATRPGGVAGGPLTPAAGVLALQRAAGNTAVGKLLSMQRSWSSSPAAEPQEDDGEIRDAGGPIAGVETDATADTEAPQEEAAPEASCRIDVRATKISGLGPLPIYHLFVIYVDSAGKPFFFRGGPSARGGSGYGNIRCDHGDYKPGTIDWAPDAESVTVMRGPAACGKDATFASELSRIDGAGIPYAPTGPNSNSVARTILNKAGVPEEKPVMIAPGWGQIL